MSDPALWSHQYTSGQSSSTFAFPSDAQWFQAVGPGTVVLEMAGGVTFTRTCVGGEVYPGTYLSLTSTTCTYVVLGNGPIPPAVSPSGTAAGVTVADVGGFFTGTTAEAVLAEHIVISVQVLNEFANVARRKLGLAWPALRPIRHACSAVSRRSRPVTPALPRRSSRQLMPRAT